MLTPELFFLWVLEFFVKSAVFRTNFALTGILCGIRLDNYSPCSFFTPKSIGLKCMEYTEIQFQTYVHSLQADTY